MQTQYATFTLSATPTSKFGTFLSNADNHVVPSISSRMTRMRISVLPSAVHFDVFRQSPITAHQPLSLSTTPPATPTPPNGPLPVTAN